MRLVPKERVRHRTVEQNVELLVSQEIVDVAVPPIMEKIVEEVKVIPQKPANRVVDREKVERLRALPRRPK